MVEEEMRRRKYARNWEHGWPHIVRVWQYMLLLLATSQIEPQLARLLKVAVLMHDVRRDALVGHAKASAEYFLSLKIKGLDEKDMEDIAYAIRNHSSGPRDWKPERKRRCDVLLGLLMLLDHMDALGHVDLLRTIQWQQSVERRMDVFSGISSKELRRTLLEGKPVERIGDVYLKDDSYLGHLLYNYLIAQPIIDYVREYVSEEFLEEIKLPQSRDFLEEMLGIQAENERCWKEKGERIIFDPFP